MSRTKIMSELNRLLRTNEDRYYIDDILNKARVIEDLQNYEPALISLLSESDTVKKHFMLEINDNKIIKINELIEIFEMNEYWDDSYTAYENKIGLTSNGDFLSDNTDVVLDFPYKDTVLKASMSKEEREKEDLLPEEPFLNEKMAREEIDTLFDSKILVNATKYDNKGHQEVTEFSEDDNLILKGNNLIALHSLKDKYAGEVKLIYIDPPFNTGNDSFLYNDKFSRSTWLSFMRNRLEVARELLTEDGNIFIHIDNNQFHYLKVLMDEIFGEDNYVDEYIWAYGSASGGRSAGAKPVNIHDYILHYSKSYTNRKANKLYTSYSEDYINDWFRYTDENGRRYRTRHRGKDENGEPVYSIQYLDESKGVPLTTVWNDIQQIYANPQAYKEENRATSEIELDFGNSGQKPEKLLERIIKMSTDKGDYVLDFFMGSGTTAATAMKLNRKFITVEQLENQLDISINRMNEVINGKQSGISKDVDWQGGGSFVYAELMEKNTGYLKDVLDADSTTRLKEVFELMLENADFDFRVDLEEVKDSVWRLPLDEQKRTLIKIIDKNQLYYNYSEIDDENVRDLISGSDYEFNQSFYGKTGETDE